MKELLIPQVNRIGSMDKSSALDELNSISRNPNQIKTDFDFENLLKDTIGKTQDLFEPLKFSSHAKARMESRDITLTPDEFRKMNEGVQKAKEKGINETLVLTDNAAFVVSAKKNVVITALEKDSVNGNLFTNIQGAFII